MVVSWHHELYLPGTEAAQVMTSLFAHARQAKGVEMLHHTNLKSPSTLIAASVLCLAILAPAGTASAATPDVDSASKTLPQDVFGIFLTDLQHGYDNEIIDHSWNGHSGTIVVTAGAVAGVEKLVSSLPIEIAVEAATPGAVPFSGRAEIETAVLSAALSIPARVRGARYEPRSDSVVLTVWADDQVAVESAFRDTFEQEAVRAQLGKPVRLETEPSKDAPVMTASTRGGLAYGGCTAGFMATSGTTYGVITAAHCTTKPATYDGSTTGTTTTVTVSSVKYDLRYTALTGGTATNLLYSGISYFPITSIGTASTGITLYKYGITAGQGTAKVTTYKGCMTYDDPVTYCGLWDTDRNITPKGDSGGPWWSGNTAYGITHGAGATSLFTAIQIAAAANVIVKKS
jgi:hypothetical protein